MIFEQDASGDFVLTNGNLTKVTDAGQVGSMRARNHLLMGEGEWTFDRRIGMPYRRLVFVKNPNMGAIREMYRNALLQVEPIVDVPVIQLDWDKGRRELAFSFEAKTEDGRTISGGFGKPFLVSD